MLAGFRCGQRRIKVGSARGADRDGIDATVIDHRLQIGERPQLVFVCECLSAFGGAAVAGHQFCIGTIGQSFGVKTRNHSTATTPNLNVIVFNPLCTNKTAYSAVRNLPGDYPVQSSGSLVRLWHDGARKFSRSG